MQCIKTIHLFFHLATKNITIITIIPNHLFTHIRFDLKISFKEFNLAWSEIFSLNKGIDRLIRWVTTQAKIAVISNTDEMHFNYIRDIFEIINVFDFIFLSYEIGYSKPEREIFETRLQAYNKSPFLHHFLIKILFLRDL